MILAATVDVLSGFDPQPFYVPPAREEGTYAQAFAAWFTSYDFTIDFAAATGSLEAGGDLQAVSRVRIPAAAAFGLIRTINEAMERYETTWGEIRYPEP